MGKVELAMCDGCDGRECYSRHRAELNPAPVAGVTIREVTRFEIELDGTPIGVRDDHGLSLSTIRSDREMLAALQALLVIASIHGLVPPAMVDPLTAEIDMRLGVSRDDRPQDAF